jgi:hypothetical protein
MCTELQTLGQFCQPHGEHTTSDNQEDHQSTYTGSCPCAQDLVCSDAPPTNSSEESDSSASSEGHGVCQTTETEKNEEEPAE